MFNELWSFCSYFCFSFQKNELRDSKSRPIQGGGASARDPSLVAGAWTERKKMYHGGSFLKLADDNMDIQNPEAQNRVFSGF